MNLNRSAIIPDGKVMGIHDGTGAPRGFAPTHDQTWRRGWFVYPHVIDKSSMVSRFWSYVIIYIHRCIYGFKIHINYTLHKYPYCIWMVTISIHIFTYIFTYIYISIYGIYMVYIYIWYRGSKSFNISVSPQRDPARAPLMPSSIAKEYLGRRRHPKITDAVFEAQNVMPNNPGWVFQIPGWLILMDFMRIPNNCTYRCIYIHIYIYT